jgi:tetratricopeptide (TPR) repeat protein
MQAATINPTPSPLDIELLRVRAHLDKSEYAAALHIAQQALPLGPTNRDLLYMIAVSQRYLHRIPDALATLDQLERHHPKYSRLFQERGHCHVALRAAPPAIDAFVRAVTLNPSLPASWNALQVLFRMVGRPADADHAADQVKLLEGLPREIATAFSMFADGEIYDAERVVRQYLLTQGDHVEGMRLLAMIGTELDVLDDAEVLSCS